MERREELAVLRHPEAVTAVAFDAEGTLVATGSPSGVTRIWNWKRNELLAVMHMHADYVRSAEFAADGRIVTASDDRTAKIYPCELCVGRDELIRLAEERLRDLDAGRSR